MPIPAKTAKVLEVLKECAKDMRTITYREIAGLCGLAAPGLGVQLGYIRDEVCRARELPGLSVIAVKTDSMLPGDGFLPDELTLPENETEVWWRGMVLQVYAYDWADVALDDEPVQPR